MNENPDNTIRGAAIPGRAAGLARPNCRRIAATAARNGRATVLVLIAAFVFCAPMHAEIDKNNLPPPPVTAEQRAALLTEFKAEEAPKQRAELRVELEKEYRTKLEQRLTEERKQYEGSLNNLWMSNAVVWGVLLLFIIWQALGAKKQASELAKLKASRESKAS